MIRLVTCASLVVLGVACSGQDHSAGPPPDAMPPPPCTPFDVTIPIDGLTHVVWIGDEYVIAKSEGESVDTVLQVVSPDGVPGAHFATIPQSEGTVEYTGEPYAWSGSSLGVIVMSNTADTFELVRFDHDGTRLGQTTVTENEMYPDYASVVWANDRFAVAWFDMTNNILTLEEISPDGVRGTVRRLTTTDAGTPFVNLFKFVSTSTSYALGLIPDAGKPPVIVVIDRKTGAVHSYDTAPAGNEFYDADLVARDPDFALLGVSSFETLDSSGMPGPIVNLPIAGDSTLLPTTTGYRIYDLQPASGPRLLMNELDALDLDPQGAAAGPLNPITTIMWPDAGSYTSYATGVFRGNGYTAYVAFSNIQMSGLRMLQQCAP